MAEIMDGKLVSKTVREEIKEEVLKLKKDGIAPGLAVIIVGEDPASKVYVAKSLRGTWDLFGKICFAGKYFSTGTYKTCK